MVSPRCLLLPDFCLVGLKVTRCVGSVRIDSRATRPATTGSNRRIPEPNSTGEGAIENSSIRPALRTPRSLDVVRDADVAAQRLAVRGACRR